MGENVSIEAPPGKHKAWQGDLAARENYSYIDQLLKTLK
jgi:hypothetical protein